MTEPDDDDKPQKKPQDKKLIPAQPEPVGMSAKKKAEDAVAKAKEAKEKMEKAPEEEKEKFKTAYEKACKEADACVKEAEKEEEEEASKKAKEAAEAEMKAKEEAEAKSKAEEAAKKEQEEKEKVKAAAELAEKTRLEASAKPIKATKEELAKLQLAAIPQPKVTMGNEKTFTQLRTDKREGENILGRIFNGGKKDEGQSTISDYAVVLNSILADPKYKAVLSQLRFMPSSNMGQFEEQRQFANANPHSKRGFSMTEVAARLSAGRTSGINFLSGMQENKTLLTTDGVFASLDTAAVEWLTLILFKLFPSEDWKNEIPIFPADVTGRNLGVIWANIAADAAIYRGTNPSPAADYSYGDTSVGMKLIPYWLQPTLWQPLSLHQFRYDQMGSGWIQNLAKLNARIGDDLIYTLLYGSYTNNPTNLVYSQGWGTAPANVSQSFNIPLSGSKFKFNSAFAGDLIKPGYNDILAIEELFMQSNYDLPKERPVLVVDSAMNRYMKSDPETKSMLTRWVNDEGADLVKVSHTLLHERSQVGAFDLPSTTVLDTHGTGVSIPATTMSAGLAFIASQVGIGLGLIDVFMIQDPSNYGYRMSVDLRINARALRSDYTGVAMYTYGTPVAPGS